MARELLDAVTELREDDALRITDELLSSGVDPLTIVAACKDAMEVIGQRFARGKAFIPELVMAGEIVREITVKVKPHLAARAAEGARAAAAAGEGRVAEGAGEGLGSTREGPGSADALGTVTLATVVLATVQGDIHDIGKDIVGTMLDIAGFEVVDLGVDVPVATVVDAVREVRPAVVALSGLLTLAFESMKATVAALTEAGLRDGCRVMIGGAPVNDAVVTYTGADGWGKDAVEGVELARRWAGGA